MNRDAGAWVSPLVAVVVLALSIAQTLAALRATGAFGWSNAAPRVRLAPAYQSLERAFDRRDPTFALQGLRDPFTYGDAGVRAAVTPPKRQKPPVVEPPATPLLTAIVWDNDPRALVRWSGREWTVREGGIFDAFQVVSIARDQVALRRGAETLILRRQNPGE